MSGDSYEGDRLTETIGSAGSVTSTGLISSGLSHSHPGSPMMRPSSLRKSARVAYQRAREDYDAPLPAYDTASDAIAEFDAALAALKEINFFDFEPEAMNTTVIACDEDITADAVRALDHVCRASETGESLLVLDSGTSWDANTEQVIDTLSPSMMSTVARLAGFQTGFTTAYTSRL